MTFNPSSPGNAPEIKVDTGFLSGVACPSVTQCTAVDHAGREVTFDPTSPGTPSSVTIDGGVPLASIACPSLTQCTAVGERGQELTFNPTAPESPAATTVLGAGSGDSFVSLACASIAQCIALDLDGDGVTFNPNAPGSPGSGLDIDGGIAVACPSATQCTVVGGPGEEWTFNPSSPGKLFGDDIDFVRVNPVGLELVACPSATQCTAIDTGGNELTFNPRSPGTPARFAIGDGTPMRGLACPSLTQCVAIGDTGPEVTFNPRLPTSGEFLGSPSLDADMVSVKLTCDGPGQICRGVIDLRTTEDLAANGKTPVFVAANTTPRSRSISLLVGRARFTGFPGVPEKVKVQLNAKGQQLLRRYRRLPAELTLTTTNASGRQTTVAAKTITFRSTDGTQTMVRGCTASEPSSRSHCIRGTLARRLRDGQACLPCTAVSPFSW